MKLKLNLMCVIFFSLPRTAKRTQSLLDLRFVQTTTRIVQRSKDKSDSVSLNSYDMRLQKNLAKDSKMKAAAQRSGSKEHIYHTMEAPHKKSLGRNCVSLENLGVFVTEDAFTGATNGSAFPPSYPHHMQPMYPCFYYNSPFPPLQQQPHQPFYMGFNSYLAHQNSAYFNSSSLGNSKQSLDDYRKYRDVALWGEQRRELQLETTAESQVRPHSLSAWRVV